MVDIAKPLTYTLAYPWVRQCIARVFSCWRLLWTEVWRCKQLTIRCQRNKRCKLKEHSDLFPSGVVCYFEIDALTLARSNVYKLLKMWILVYQARRKAMKLFIIAIASSFVFGETNRLSPNFVLCNTNNENQCWTKRIDAVSGGEKCVYNPTAPESCLSFKCHKSSIKTHLSYDLFNFRHHRGQLNNLWPPSI